MAKKKRSRTPEAVSQYLSDIGSKGGKARAAKHSKKQLSEWAKKGGRPRQPKT